MNKDKNTLAIRVDSLTKTYRLYNKPIDRLKESVNIFGKNYHKVFYALNNISFDIKKGECVGIIGKNGSGKSTLLKIITGVLTPTSGQVKVEGNISALLELGSGFNPEYTGMENIFLNGIIMGYSEKEIAKKINDIINFADIGDFIRQPVKTYSSGMFIRLAFAVAINVDPDILIVDEALAVGDLIFQLKCYRKFNDFKEKGKTILFVTHSIEHVLRYCNRVIVINDGEKIAEGLPKEMVDVYKQLLVNCYDIQVGGDTREKILTRRTAYWKELFDNNPNTLEYGNKFAEITDYGIFDNKGNPVTILHSDEMVIVKMKVSFYKDINDPIFAFTIKDIKGNELVGTNTLYENLETGSYKQGDEVIITFTQRLNLQSGNYALSLGCTGYIMEELVVYHRLYDVILFEINSLRKFVGLFDINSTVKVVGVNGIK